MTDAAQPWLTGVGIGDGGLDSLSSEALDALRAAKTIFGKRIAHGALTASYISGILGNNLPGPGAIFIGLSMRFKRPVHIGDEVTVRAEVSEKKERGNRVTLKVDCTVDGKRVITGEAEVVAPRRGD